MAFATEKRVSLADQLALLQLRLSDAAQPDARSGGLLHQ